MPLTQQQLSALPTLEWLLGEDENSRRSGRSLVIAVAAIRQACAVPGRQIHIFDHWDGQTRGISYILSVVRRLVLHDLRIANSLTMFRDSFRIELGEPIYDWFPTEESLGTNPGPILPPELVGPPPPTAWERLSQDE
jgi:hypothetical protein